MHHVIVPCVTNHPTEKVSMYKKNTLFLNNGTLSILNCCASRHVNNVRRFKIDMCNVV